MKRIDYLQSNDKEKKDFCNKFYNIIINETKFNVDELNIEIKKIDVNWDYEKLLTSGFSELLDFAKKAKLHNIDTLNLNFKWKNSKNKDEYFYTSLQRNIADFLINSKLRIKSCPYCNIDFINPFNVFIEYKNVDEFMKYGTCDEWQELLSTFKGKLVHNKIRELKIASLNELKTHKLEKVGNETWKKVNIRNINNLKMFREQFTLDHFIPKGTFPFLSLSIYNLIPSCYSCNSKFKGQREFELSDFMNFISPSSETFCMDNYLSFKLGFDTKTNKFEEKLKNIKQIEDLEVNLTNTILHPDIDKYVDMFRLKGRYNFHKNIAYELTEKRKRYPEKQIDEIVKIFRREKIIIDKKDIKKDIFGKECFDSNNEPFEKYKQDIAKQLGII